MRARDHGIVLGRLQFPRKTAMTLQTNSISRAIEGARFFGARLGPLAVALRVRLVNRCFAASEGGITELAKSLDQDVVGARFARQQALDGGKKIVGDGAAQAAIGQFDDIVLGAGVHAAIAQNVPVDADVADMVFVAFISA